MLSSKLAKALERVSGKVEIMWGGSRDDSSEAENPKGFLLVLGWNNTILAKRPRSKKNGQFVDHFFMVPQICCLACQTLMIVQSLNERIWCQQGMKNMPSND